MAKSGGTTPAFFPPQSYRGSDRQPNGAEPDIIHANDWRRPDTASSLREDEGPDRLHRPQSCLSGPLRSITNAVPGLSAAGFPITDSMAACLSQMRDQRLDAVTTVSPTYASEILSAEHGCGLMDCCASAPLHSREFEWRGLWPVDPGIDPHLPRNYRPAPSARRNCATRKRNLARTIPTPAGPI
jgi:hypothetical protein